MGSSVCICVCVCMCVCVCVYVCICVYLCLYLSVEDELVLVLDEHPLVCILYH